MLIQTQPNKWSCLITSFAIVLDTPVQKLIEEVGHDGSAFIWPELPEPYRRKSFHIQEMIDCCMGRGLMVMPIEAYPVSIPHFDFRLKEVKTSLETAFRDKELSSKKLEHLVNLVNGITCNEHLIQFPGNEERMRTYLSSFSGVLIGETVSGRPHAVAWDLINNSILDPAETKITNLEDFVIETFYAIS